MNLELPALSDLMEVHMDLEAFKERLAAIEHERWASWQRWVHSRCERQEDGSLLIPALLVERWERQMATPYAQLSREEQLKDLREVDSYWSLILEALKAK